MVVTWMFCFSRANHASTNLKKSFSDQNSTSLLYLPIPSSADTWKIFTIKLCQLFFRLSWHFKREKSVIWKASFCKTRTDYACRTSCTRLLRLVISRQLFKPSTSSRVCITVSNSPNPPRVYIRLCKHKKRLLLLKYIRFYVVVTCLNPTLVLALHFPHIHPSRLSAHWPSLFSALNKHPGNPGIFEHLQ